MEGFPSGQREQTVNLSAMPSEVRILPPPPDFTVGLCVGDVVIAASCVLHARLHSPC